MVINAEWFRRHPAAVAGIAGWLGAYHFWNLVWYMPKEEFEGRHGVLAVLALAGSVLAALGGSIAVSVQIQDEVEQQEREARRNKP